mmetsp:Transcript_14837/g.29773  ORF Transcript_14837/g.29773 Transcript_14837/m.29773 type:complete len:241 (+) Transcript_14837:2329-3051(+)
MGGGGGASGLAVPARIDREQLPWVVGHGLGSANGVRDAHVDVLQAAGSEILVDLEIAVDQIRRASGGHVVSQWGIEMRNLSCCIEGDLTCLHYTVAVGQDDGHARIQLLGCCSCRTEGHRGSTDRTICTNSLRSVGGEVRCIGDRSQSSAERRHAAVDRERRRSVRHLAERSVNSHDSVRPGIRRDRAAVHIVTRCCISIDVDLNHDSGVQLVYLLSGCCQLEDGGGIPGNHGALDGANI